MQSNATWHHNTSTWRQVEHLGRILNGSWYSTQAAGECQQGQLAGKDCWWRLVEQTRNINASCVSENVIAAVMQHAKEKKSLCFETCPSVDRSSPCWINCLFQTLVGSPEKKIPAMTKAQITAPFVRSFQSADPKNGGCPEVPPCPSPCKPPTYMYPNIV